MVCPKCNNQISDGAKFCARCGAQIPAAQEKTEPAPQRSENPVNNLFPNAFDNVNNGVEEKTHISPTQLESLHADMNRQAAVNQTTNPANNVGNGAVAPQYTPSPVPTVATTPSEDKSSIGLNILSLLFPLIGAFLFCGLSKNHPNRARDCWRAAVLGVILFSVISICVAVIVGFVGAASAIGGLADISSQGSVDSESSITDDGWIVID